MYKRDGFSGDPLPGRFQYADSAAPATGLRIRGARRRTQGVGRD
jgi:hypothetical protein